jgi:hypothetical protein
MLQAVVGSEEWLRFVATCEASQRAASQRVRAPVRASSGFHSTCKIGSDSFLMQLGIRVALHWGRISAMQEALSHSSLVTGTERFSDDVLAPSARRTTKLDCIVHILVWRSVAEGRRAGELKLGSPAPL